MSLYDKKGNTTKRVLTIEIKERENKIDFLKGELINHKAIALSNLSTPPPTNMTTTAPLCEEGKRLFLLGMCPKMRSRHKLKNLVCSLFHTGYDDHLEFMQDKMFQCSKALYALVLSEEDSVGVDEKGSDRKDGTAEAMLHSAVLNTVKAILSFDSERSKTHEIKQNFRFFFNLMKCTFANGDHQTAITVWLALTHGSVARIDCFKRPKQFPGFCKSLEAYYGKFNSMFARHAHEVIENGYKKDFYPSLLACFMFLKSQESRDTYEAERHELFDTLRIYAFQSRSFRADTSDLLPIYTEKGTSGRDLYSISDQIVYKNQVGKRRHGSLEHRQWTKNKVFMKDLKQVGIVYSPSKSTKVRRAIS
jgi:hypothetical protein